MNKYLPWFTVVCTLVGVGIWAGTQSTSIDANASTIEKVETTVDKVEDTQKKVLERITRIETKIDILLDVVEKE